MEIKEEEFEIKIAPARPGCITELWPYYKGKKLQRKGMYSLAVKQDADEPGVIVETRIQLTAFAEMLVARDMFDGNKGQISDGYHTFDELYTQRAYLWATILNMNPRISWKSHKHEDGSMFDGMFIAGIETPKGQYTFHIDDEWWNMFNVEELESAPHWDGHQPSDITRLSSLETGEKHAEG